MRRRCRSSPSTSWQSTAGEFDARPTRQPRLRAQREDFVHARHGGAACADLVGDARDHRGFHVFEGSFAPRPHADTSARRPGAASSAPSSPPSHRRSRCPPNRRLRAPRASSSPRNRSADRPCRRSRRGTWHAAPDVQKLARKNSLRTARCPSGTGTAGRRPRRRDRCRLRCSRDRWRNSCASGTARRRDSRTACRRSLRGVAENDWPRAVIAQRLEMRYAPFTAMVGKMPASESFSRLSVPGSLPSALVSMMCRPSPSPASNRSDLNSE